MVTRSQKTKAATLGFIASLISAFTHKNKKKDTDDLSKIEYKNSTQTMGITFNDRIRNAFRFRWIKRT